MILNASTYNLLNATKFKALASLTVAHFMAKTQINLKVGFRQLLSREWQLHFCRIVDLKIFVHLLK